MEVFCSLKKKPSKLSGSWKSIRLKKNHQSGPKILCPRLALDLGSGEAGNCGALTIENRQKILSDLKTFYSYAWMVHETSIFSIFPPRITRHASHASFRSKALRRLIFLGTRHPVRRKWSNILGPVGSAKLKPTSTSPSTSIKPTRFSWHLCVRGLFVLWCLQRPSRCLASVRICTLSLSHSLNHSDFSRLWLKKHITYEVIWRYPITLTLSFFFRQVEKLPASVVSSF